MAEPTVVVLMATHQGERWLAEQMDSILDQQGVAVRVVVSDDASTDGTRAMLARYAHDERVTLLEPGTFGSAQASFLRLIRDVEAADADAIAFADQDDVWHATKLATQLAQLQATGARAVSGDVRAVFDDRSVVIRKSQPQRSLDFVCESAGPGCTYLMAPETFATVRAVCMSDPRTDGVAAHDWLVYAIARAAGLPWHIDPEPLVEYRQHGDNVIGANVGLLAARRRASRLRSGSFRLDCALVAEIAADVASDGLAVRLRAVARDLRAWDAGARARVLALTPQLRRRHRDRTALATLTALRLW